MTGIRFFSRTIRPQLAKIAIFGWTTIVLATALGCADLTKPQRPITGTSVVSAPPASALSAESAALLAAVGMQRHSLPNLETLEGDENLTTATSAESRALLLSELWFQRGVSIAPSSQGGSFASYLRSAELSLTALLGEGCSSVFNPTCSQLGSQYTAATRAVLNALQSAAWKAPSLATTQYDLSLRGPSGALFLKDWKLSLPGDTENKHNTAGYRSGIGLAGAGCRVFALSAESVGVCSPLTFVLSFSQTPEGEKTEAALSVYDAYEREVVSLNGRTVPLAGDFSAASSMLSGLLAEKKPEAPLSCVSIPAAETNTVVVVGSPKSLRRYHETVMQLLSDPEIRARFSFCFYSAAKKSPPATLVKDLREVIAPRDTTRLTPPHSPVTLVAVDSIGERLVDLSTRTLTADPRVLHLAGVISVVSSRGQAKQAERLGSQLSRMSGVSVATITTAQQPPEGPAQRRTKEALRAALMQIPSQQTSEQTTPLDEHGDLAVSSVL